MIRFLQFIFTRAKFLADEDIRSSAQEYLSEYYHSLKDEKGGLSVVFYTLFRFLVVLFSLIWEQILWRCILFKNYMKITLRILTRHKGFSIINIMGLAIGLACCILISLWIQHELSYDRFHENAENLYRVYAGFLNEKDQTVHTTYLPAPLAGGMKSQFPEIIDAVRQISLSDNPLKYQEKSFSFPGTCFDSSFFKMFSYPIVKGDPSNLLADPLSIVLSERAAEVLFGDEDPIGKTIKFAWWGRWIDVSVSGIFQNKSNSHLRHEYVLPNTFVDNYGWKLDKWDDSSYPTYILLQEKADMEMVAEKINLWLKQRFPEGKSTIHLQPVTRIHLFSLSGGGPITYIYIFTAVGILILLIACINFMNLSTARASTRAKEVGIRKVVGANRTQLMGQFFAESLFFSVFSMVLALVMAKVTLPFLNNLLDLNLGLSLSGAFFPILAGLILFTGILAGSYPALFLSKFQPVRVIKGHLGSGSRTPLLRRTLVVSQFTVSIFLIIGTMVITRQMDYIRKKDLGFNQEHILHLIFRGEFGRKYEAVKQELLNHPAIVSITASNCSFVGRSNGIGMGHWEGKTQEGTIPMALHAVDYDFFQTFDMKLVQGRSFSREFSTDEKKSFIFNEEAIRAMGMESPLGKMVTCRVGRGIQTGKIIGVVGDYQFNSLHNEIRPLVFVMAPWWYRDVFVKIKPGNMAATIVFLKETIMRLVPDYHFEYKFLDAEIDRLYRAEDRAGTLLGYGALLAVFIACLGLFGLAAFIVEQRTKEIGIRKVLGASIPGISLMLSQEFAKWVLLANIIAWPLAWVAAQSWLRDFYYRTGISLWIFLAAGLMALAIAVGSVSFQAIKAARANPVESLRYE